MEVILILARSVLREPEDDGGKHERDVLTYVCQSIVDKPGFIRGYDILEHQHTLYNTLIPSATRLEPGERRNDARYFPPDPPP